MLSSTQYALCAARSYVELLLQLPSLPWSEKEREHIISSRPKTYNEVNHSSSPLSDFQDGMIGAMLPSGSSLSSASCCIFGFARR